MNRHEDWRSTLDVLIQKRHRLEEQIERQKKDIEAIKRAEFILRSHYEPSLLNQSMDDEEVKEIDTAEFEHLRPHEAILNIIREHPDIPWRPRALAKELIRRGIRTKSRNFPYVVASCLNRLKREGKIERIQNGAIWFYKYVEENKNNEEPASETKIPF